MNQRSLLLLTQGTCILNRSMSGSEVLFCRQRVSCNLPNKMANSIRCLYLPNPLPHITPPHPLKKSLESNILHLFPAFDKHFGRYNSHLKLRARSADLQHTHHSQEYAVSSLLPTTTKNALQLTWVPCSSITALIMTSLPAWDKASSSTLAFLLKSFP